MPATGEPLASDFRPDRLCVAAPAGFVPVSPGGSVPVVGYRPAAMPAVARDGAALAGRAAALLAGAPATPAAPAAPVATADRPGDGPAPAAGPRGAPPARSVPGPPAPASAAALAEARAAGRRDGRAEAQAELAACREEAAAAARALATALARLTDPRGAGVEALERAIDAAVSRLAAQRAGQAIDAAPAPFARRIARLAAQVGAAQAAVTVHLHPEDLRAVAPLLTAACPPEIAALAAARLVADPSLDRGDADIRAPGIRLAELGLDPGADGRPDDTAGSGGVA